MDIPAGKRRRSRIKWDDDGPILRVDKIAFEEGSPYKALALAGILGVMSIAAVVGVIQFQRHAGWSDIDASIVETAQATPKAPDAGSDMAEATLSTTGKPTVDGARSAVEVDTKTAPALDPGAANIQSASAASGPSKGTEAPAVEPVPIVATPADPMSAEAEDMEPLTLDDPRWRAPEAGAAATHADESPADTGDALAFAPVEMPKTPPMPAPRPEKVTAPAEAKPAVVEAKPETVAASTDAMPTNAKVRSSVFLRSGPTDGSRVVLTIPAGAGVKMDAGCRHWCSVTYQGKSGFVYKKFLSR